MKKISYIIFLLIISVYSCKPEIEEFKPSAGEADFSRYLAFGSTTTSGFADGALYRSGQYNSYPNLIAVQLKTVGSGDFLQPLVNSEFGFLQGKMKLGYKTNCLGTTLAPIPDIGNLEGASVSYIPNNLGIPGLKSFHSLLQGYALLNPYYERFASNTLTSRVIDEISVINPTFFTLWIGDYDIYSYAIEGGASDSITNPIAFQNFLNTIINALKANGAKGAIANIPDITDIPFFTTIPYNALVIKDQNLVNMLNFSYHPINLMLQANGLDTISFKIGANPFVIEDPASPLPAPFKIRQIKAGELITLKVPNDSISCNYWGSQKPIPHKYILDLNEINKIITAINSYNEIILNSANTNNLAFVDIKKLYKNVKSEIFVDGIKYSSAFISGGFYSLDGLNPSARGNAIIANTFIEAINLKYNSKILKTNINDKPTIIFP